MELVRVKKTSERNATTKVQARALPLAQRVTDEIETALGTDWIPSIYRQRVLTERTRSHALPVASSKLKARVSVQHTLLGIELKIGQRRVMCPDLATARYLSVFARAGCTNVVVPYNITKISRLADDLETSWERMMLLADEHADTAHRSQIARVKNALIAKILDEVTSASRGKEALLDFNNLLTPKARTIL